MIFVCFREHTHAPFTFDLFSRCGRFVSADVGKTVDRRLAFYILWAVFSVLFSIFGNIPNRPRRTEWTELPDLPFLPFWRGVQNDPGISDPLLWYHQNLISFQGGFVPIRIKSIAHIVNLPLLREELWRIRRKRMLRTTPQRRRCRAQPRVRGMLTPGVFPHWPTCASASFVAMNP